MTYTFESKHGVVKAETTPEAEVVLLSVTKDGVDVLESLTVDEQWELSDAVLELDQRYWDEKRDLRS